jgi:NADPH:quinone reductase-like Zn-dependent oxidoreductase
MAQLCLVDDRHRFPIPVGMDAEVAAAIAIPGMSSWAALVERAQVRVGETVLINGATGVSGRLAIQIAKHLGVKKVIATGRRVSEALRALGADVIVPLTGNQAALEEALEQVFRDGVDIVLDYLWGPSAQTLISAAAKASPEGIPIRYVEIGAVTASTIELPSAALRASGLKLMGSGIGSVALPQLLRAISGVLHAAPVAGFATAVQSMPLSEVTQAWASAQTDERIVLRP